MYFQHGISAADCQPVIRGSRIDFVERVDNFNAADNHQLFTTGMFSQPALPYSQGHRKPCGWWGPYKSGPASVVHFQQMFASCTLRRLPEELHSLASPRE